MSDRNTESRMTFEAVRTDPSLEIGDKVNKLIRLQMCEHPDLSYKKARIAISNAYPEVLQEYLNTAPPLHVARGGTSNA